MGRNPRLLLFFCSAKSALKLVVSDRGFLIPGSRVERQRIASLRKGFQTFLEASKNAFIYIFLARLQSNLYTKLQGRLKNACLAFFCWGRAVLGWESSYMDSNQFYHKGRRGAWILGLSQSHRCDMNFWDLERR